MKKARIAILLLVGIMLVSGLACGAGVKGSVEMPPEFQGFVEVEHEAVWKDFAQLGKVLMVEGLIWNMGTQTIHLSYQIYFYDSRGRVLSSSNERPPSYYLPHSLKPGENIGFQEPTAQSEKVTSYKIILKKRIY